MLDIIAALMGLVGGFLSCIAGVFALAITLLTPLLAMFVNSKIKNKTSKIVLLEEIRRYERRS